MGRYPLDELIRIGSRKSVLARLQAYMVGSALQKIHPQVQISYHFQESAGDKDLTSPLWKMPGKGVFTRDLQIELIENRIDCIVHSWKDLDLEDRGDTEVISVLPREDQRDLLLFKKESFSIPPSELIFCTSSPRREYNLSEFFSSHLPKRLQTLPLNFHPIRGNVQTRIRTFLEGNFSGLIVAKAAIDRILRSEELELPPEESSEIHTVKVFIRESLEKCLFSVLPLSADPNAPAQGSLALEILKTNSPMKQLFSELTDPATESSTTKERKILSLFGGGCHQKIGVAIQKHSYGEICFLKGLTDSGQNLHRSDVVQEVNEEYCKSLPDPAAPTDSRPRYAKDEIWPLGGTMAVRDRKRMEVEIPKEKDLFITRGYALPESVKILPHQLVWTAGSTTWKELGNRDIWVHGSFDGLGEHPLEEELFVLVGRELTFTKLTHKDSQETESFPTLFTYSAGDPQIPDSFSPEKIKAAFWRSSTEFEIVTKQFPILKQVDTFCGPGSTYQHLSKDPVIQTHKKLQIFLSFKDWVAKCTV